MKFYIASSMNNKAEVREVMSILIALGHQISHDWTDHEVDRQQSEQEQRTFLERCGFDDYEGVLKADAVILVNHAECHDSMAEFGMAVGANKPVCVYHPSRRFSVFFHLCSQAHDLPTLLSIIRSYENGVVYETRRT